MKLSRSALFLAVIPALLLFGVGCGGISGGGSVSPATFFLPGLMQNNDKSKEMAPLAAHPHPDIHPTADQSL